MEQSGLEPIPTSSDQGSFFELGLPQKEGKKGYLMSYFMARNEIIQIIKITDKPFDSKLVNAVRALISFVDEDVERRKMFEDFNNKLDEIDAMPDLSLDKKLELKNRHLWYMMGEVTGYFDRAIGLSHKLVARLL